MTLLGDEGVRAALADLPGWSGDARAISRTVTAPDFLTGIRVVDDVALVAETMDHHPDIDIRGRTVTFALVTHSAGGITENDWMMAREIDQIVGP